MCPSRSGRLQHSPDAGKGTFISPRADFGAARLLAMCSDRLSQKRRFSYRGTATKALAETAALARLPRDTIAADCCPLSRVQIWKGISRQDQPGTASRTTNRLVFASIPLGLETPSAATSRR